MTDNNDKSKRDHRDPRYVVYKNDLKYRQHRDIVVDPKKTVWDNKEVENLYKYDLDTVEYRLHELKSEKYETLDLTHLGLTSMPKIQKEITVRVKNLFLGNNKFTEFPDLSMFTNLEILEINYNKISKIENLPESLLELACQDNLLNSISYGKTKLQRLNCKNNKLMELDLLKLKNANVIDCSYNKLYGSIKNLSNLTHLYCGNNYIVSVSECSNLVYLDCKENPIVSIETCNKLEHLVCSGTKLTKIPDCQMLQSIECFKTNISSLYYFEKLYEILCNTDQLQKISSKYVITKANVYKDKLVHINFATNNK